MSDGRTTTAGFLSVLECIYVLYLILVSFPNHNDSLVIVTIIEHTETETQTHSDTP